MSKEFVDTGAKEYEKGSQEELGGNREKAIAHFQRALSNYQLAIKHEPKGSTLRVRMITFAIDIMEKIKQIEQCIMAHHSSPLVQQPQPLIEGPLQGVDQFEQVKPENLPDLSWDDVIGLEGVKQELKMTVQYPMEIPQIYVGNRQAARGILLYGPPGVGKTMIVKVLAKECRMNFFSISSADIISKWVGDSAKNMKALFEKVKASKPAILFIDEIEAMCPSKDGGGGGAGGGGGNIQHSGEAMKVVNEILTQMNGLTSDAEMDGVLVIGATNYPWFMDDAILRRFPRRILLPLPNKEDRLKLLSHRLAHNTQDIGPPLDEDYLEYLAEKTELFSNSDLVELVRYASNMTTEEIINGNYFRLLTDYSSLGEEGGEGKWSIVVMTEEEILQDTSIKSWCLPYKELKPELKALLKSRAISERHLNRAMQMTKPVTSHEKLKLFDKWTQEHGSSLSVSG